MANANFFSPDGGITRYPLEDTEGRITYGEEIHGINLLNVTAQTGTSGGITFTVNNDKTISLSNAQATGNCRFVVGTATLDAGTYWVSGAPNNDFYFNVINESANDHGSGATLILSERKTITLQIAQNGTHTASGNLVAYPMITKIEYAGIPYRPYNQQSIQNQLNAQTGVLGAKKLLPFPYIDGTQVIDGVTFTVNNNTEKVTANGTPDSGKYPALKLANANFLNSLVTKYGAVIVSGCPAGGGNSTYQLFTRSASKGYLYERGDELYLDCTDLNDYLYVQIRDGYTASNVVFDPSIRLASDPDRSHSLYAMTNRELTELAIKKGTYTGTLSASGNLILPTNQDIICVVAASTANIVDGSAIALIPYYSGNYVWVVHAMKAMGWTAVANEEITVTYYYH